MAKQTISKNLEKGALQSDYANQYPNLESGLAVSYAASLAGLHDVSNKAREIAYTKGKINDVPDFEKVSYSFTPTEQSEYKPKEKNKVITGIGTALDVMSLVPGIDTVTNLISIPFDIYEGDYIGALLSAVGAIPLVGELADTAKAARVGVKIADKAHDVSKFAKVMDKTLDVLKNPKVIETTGRFGQCLYDGMLTGRVYESDGKSYSEGFRTGFTSSLISTSIESLNKDSPALTIIGNTVGSAIVTIIEGLESGENIEKIAENTAKSAAEGFLSGTGSAYINSAITLSNEAASAAKTLMNYDENFGKCLELFFNSLITILNSKEF